MFSSSSEGAAGILAVLMDPVLEVASMAGQRPYLTSEAINTSFEMIYTAVRLVLSRRKGQPEKGDRIEGQWETCTSIIFAM